MVKLANRVDAVRRVTQNIYEQEYQQALVQVKEKIRDTEGPDMREAMQDQIRQWFIECRLVLRTKSISLVQFDFHLFSNLFVFNKYSYFTHLLFNVYFRDELSSNAILRYEDQNK